MKRRNISIGGKSLTSRQADVDMVKANLAAKLAGNDAETIAKFAAFIVQSGWTPETMESAMKQNANGNRPPLSAFLWHHEHTIDQVMLNQGAYTEMRDTAADPNFAIRMPGETELLLRRLQPGDLWMLQAAHHLQARNPVDGIPAPLDPNYWRSLWAEMRLIANLGRSDRAEHDAALAYGFVLQYSQDEIFGNDSEQVARTFLNPSSAFFCGITHWARARVRSGGGYTDLWTVDATTDENYCMASCILFAYGVDAHARSILASGDRLHNDNYLSIVRLYVARNREAKVETIVIAEEQANENNQESFDTAGPDFGDSGL